MDPVTPANTGRPPTTETKPQQPLRFTLFAITPDNTAKVRKQLEEHRKVAIRPVLPGEPPVGIYLGIVDGSNGSPDKMVLVQVRGERTHACQVSADRYFLNKIKDLRVEELIAQSEELDPMSEETTEIRQKLRSGWLERFGIHL